MTNIDMDSIAKTIGNREYGKWKRNNTENSVDICI